MAEDTVAWTEEDTYEYTTLAKFEELLTKRGKVTGKIRVQVPLLGRRNCYLGTPLMDMRFQGQYETVVYGNLSLDWVIRPAAKGAKLISNAVTDEANERPKFFATETYLEAKNSHDGEYNLQMKGKGSLFHFEEDKGKKLYAIYTEVEEGGKAYLQPARSGEHTITAIVGPPKFIFKLPRIIASKV